MSQVKLIFLILIAKSQNIFISLGSKCLEDLLFILFTELACCLNDHKDAIFDHMFLFPSSNYDIYSIVQNRFSIFVSRRIQMKKNQYTCSY